MMRHSRLDHRFVQLIPDHLEPGLLYVSVEFGTAVHACCCGCGEEVVTPFTPTDWKMTYDGQSISLWPSVGSWTLKCRSHYVIEQGMVLESKAWSDDQIAEGRRREKAAKIHHFKERQPVDVPELAPTETVKVKNWGTRIREFFSRVRP